MSKKKKIILSLFLLLIVGGGVGGYLVYRWIYEPNVDLDGKKSVVIFIPTGSNYERVLEILNEQNIIKDEKSFDWVAKEKKYKENVKPGRYRVLAGMSNSELINMLRVGNQEPVTLTFNNIRTKAQLAGRVGAKLEADSTVLLKMLNDADYLHDKFGMTTDNIISMFIPNTYEFFWNTDGEEFMKRMAKEYRNFWTEDRKARAKQSNLTQTQVAILASIVQEEQNRFNDEKSVIAGLYLNRIKKDMLLQSDPTVRFAIGDFSVSRILNSDLQIDSPYNTYKYPGLPPGPICIPEISSLDAVLNYDHNDYIFMCAKEDFSGHHNFSKTLQQHLIYAKKYQQALNQRNIKR
jgi:UPF0755 protein